MKHVELLTCVLCHVLQLLPAVIVMSGEQCWNSNCKECKLHTRVNVHKCVNTSKEQVSRDLSLSLFLKLAGRACKEIDLKENFCLLA